MTFHVKLSPPPSANNMYVNRRGKGGRIKSPKYRAWRQQAVLEIYAQVPAPMRVGGPVAVFISLPADTRSDLDNNIKPILDALVDSRRIDDDRHVVSVSAHKNNDEPMAAVMVTACAYESAERRLSARDAEDRRRKESAG